MRLVLSCLALLSSYCALVHVVGQDDVVFTCPQEWVLNASVTLYCEVKKSSITAKCDTAPNSTVFTQDEVTGRCTVGSADYHTCSFDNPSSTSCGCRQNATHYTFVYHISEVGEYDGGDWNCDKGCNPSFGLHNPLTKYINPACRGVNVTESQVCPRHNTWSCSNGGCIWIDWRCDGEAHCDGSDEQNCADWNCSLSWWKCGNDMQCIWKLDRCDGDVDCADGSDEKNCENWPCGQTWWKCGDRTLCIPRRFRCDGTTQCDDGSDEQHCDTAVVTSLTLDGHSDTITVDGDDHRTLNLTCRVFGRVKGLVTIQKESDVFGNVTFRSNNINYRRLGTYTYDAVMTLTDVTCGDTGRYICAVSQGISGIGSKSIQLNVACAGIKYGGKLTCPGAWKIGQDVKLTLTLDRSIWPSICRTDPDRREARFEVIKWSDPGRQSIMCTVVNITSPGACQGNFTPGTIGCGCVNKTDEHFTLELNFVMDSTSIGNWSADTLCLRIDSSKQLQLHVAPECNVRLDDVVLTCPHEWVLNASVTLYCEVKKSSITAKCDTANNNTFFTQHGTTARCVVGPADYNTCSFDNPSSTSCGCRQNVTHYTFVYHISEVGEDDGGDWNCEKACNPAVGFQNPLTKYINPVCSGVNVKVVGQDDVVLTCPQEWVLNASVTLYCEVRKSSITSKCDTAPNNTLFAQDGATSRCVVGPADYHTCSFDNPSSTSCGCRQNATHYTFVYHISQVGEGDGGDWECYTGCIPASGFQNPLTKYTNPACRGVNVTGLRSPLGPASHGISSMTTFNRSSKLHAGAADTPPADTDHDHRHHHRTAHSHTTPALRRLHHRHHHRTAHSHNTPALRRLHHHHHHRTAHSENTPALR
ncbi:uncharacterized protein [Littorina saxatilis]|uniref:uncharacterized protein isoform X2 n=1 Tax=Littorina saxatilis TaxID=31220 RepID=UPI0038B6971A